jgi:hypothetical protein
LIYANIGKGEGHDDDNSAEADRKQRAGADESRSSLQDGDDSTDRIYGGAAAKGGGGGGGRGNNGDGEGYDAEGDGDSGSGSDNDDAEGVESANMLYLPFDRSPSHLCLPSAYYDLNISDFPDLDS